MLFKIKTDHKLELLSNEAISTEKVVAKYKNGENVPKLKIIDVISIHCNVVNKSYQ